MLINNLLRLFTDKSRSNFVEKNHSINSPPFEGEVVEQLIIFLIFKIYLRWKM